MAVGAEEQRPEAMQGLLGALMTAVRSGQHLRPQRGVFWNEDTALEVEQAVHFLPASVSRAGRDARANGRSVAAIGQLAPEVVVQLERRGRDRRQFHRVAVLMGQRVRHRVQSTGAVLHVEVIAEQLGHHVC